MDSHSLAVGTVPVVAALQPGTRFDAALLAQARQQAGEQMRTVDALQVLVALEPEVFVQRLGATLHYPVLSCDTLFACNPAFDQLPLAQAIKRDFVMVHLGNTLIGVFADPFDNNRLAWIDARLNGAPLYLVHPADLSGYLARQEESYHAVDSLNADTGDVAELEDIETLSLARISEDSSVVVKLVNSTLYDALKIHASDIHLGMTGNGLVIKYRIDGVLNSISRVQGAEIAEQVISRIKVMAELDIGEKRVPQDGRFKVSISGRQIDFRVSIMPSIFGEDAVLRVLDKQDLADQVQGVSLEALGFEASIMKKLRRLAAEPYGMVLVTGPTGSGKTTTLYAMITEINHGVEKIVTIEDPVEYVLPGVLQIPVNEKKGLTFARGLRSILRHDPDKIMVGEIRDPDTAQIAVQSALTGHLVFTTIHANNVFDVIGRFTQMEVDPYSFVAALNAVLAQRLIRLVCPTCAQPVTPSAEQLQASGIALDQASSYRFVQGVGCGRCRGTGYRGRTAIAELLQLDDEIRQLIIDREPIARLKEQACKRGLRLLRTTALELVQAGKTTLEEINRVTFSA